MENKICGTCRNHRIDPYDDGWRCVCGDSDYCTEWTEYTDTCDEWEGKE